MNKINRLPIKTLIMQKDLLEWKTMRKITKIRCNNLWNSIILISGKNLCLKFIKKNRKKKKKEN